MTSCVGLGILILLLNGYYVRGLTLTIFYESLCPFSSSFITYRLYPVYQIVRPYLDVEFVPYGIAKHTTSPFSVKCQHGPNECLGNAIQACFIARQTRTDLTMDFVACVMKSPKMPWAGTKCANNLGLDYEGVEMCARDVQGKLLTAQLGLRTHSFTPTIDKVPTVVFDNVYNDTVQRLKGENLLFFICERLPVPQKPEACRDVSFRIY